MPRKRATRVNKHAKPKKPEGDNGSQLDPEKRRKQLEAFLHDFDVEVQRRLQKIESEKRRIQSLIEKNLNLQLSFLPKEIREMNIMDFLAAGGTVPLARQKLEENRKDSMPSEGFVQATCKKMGKGGRRGKAAANKAVMPPPTVSPSAAKKRSRFQTPMTRQLPAVWDTPAVTPKFDVNLPFTPGFARGPRHGERLMSLTGSPVDVSATHKMPRTLKHARIQEEEEMDKVVSRVASAVPDFSKTDIQRILSAAKLPC